MMIPTKENMEAWIEQSKAYGATLKDRKVGGSVNSPTLRMQTQGTASEFDHYGSAMEIDYQQRGGNIASGRGGKDLNRAGTTRSDEPTSPVRSGRISNIARSLTAPRVPVPFLAYNPNTISKIHNDSYLVHKLNSEAAQREAASKSEKQKHYVSNFLASNHILANLSLSLTGAKGKRRLTGRCLRSQEAKSKIRPTWQARYHLWQYRADHNCQCQILQFQPDAQGPRGEEAIGRVKEETDGGGWETEACYSHEKRVRASIHQTGPSRWWEYEARTRKLVTHHWDAQANAWVWK